MHIILGGKIIDDDSSVAKTSFLSRRRVLFGSAIVPSLCCLAIVLAVAAGEWYRARTASRVEWAVRASFPDFCNQEGQRITVQLGATPRSLLVYRYWDVGCDSTSWIGPALTVDVQTCSVFAPPIATFEWPQVYGGMVKDGQRMAVCP